jgi:hypothetical protein
MTTASTKRRPEAPAEQATTWFPRIGQPWPGQGIYAGIVRGEPGLPDYHLFASESPASAHDKLAWGGYELDAPGANSTLDGRANTLALVDSHTDHPAAEWCHALAVDGHRDWYLPSRRELRLCWVNVPELFATGWYWSSTQYSRHGAWYQLFDVGYQDGDDKDGQARVRAVRRFLIT